MDTINSTYLWDQSCKKLDWIRFGPDEEPPEQMNVQYEILIRETYVTLFRVIFLKQSYRNISFILIGMLIVK